MSRKPKDKVSRNVYSFRLTPEAYSFLRQTADLLSVSVSDLIQNYAINFCKDRIEYEFPPVFWS